MQIHKPWTKEEVNLMRKEYPKVGAKGLLERLGRSRDTINKKAQELGVKYVPKKVFVQSQGYLTSYEIVGLRQYRKYLMHREIMEKHLGRKLLVTEVIHHKNGNRQDNRLCNLQLMTRSQHINKHRAQLVEAQRAKSKI